MRSLRIGLAALLAIAPVSAFAADANGRVGLQMKVPLVCTLSVQGTSALLDDDSVSLGSVRELCNGARGYAVTVSYAPGTLVGATLHLGADSVVLNGSGTAVISQVEGAGYRVRPLTLDAGDHGLDSAEINLAIQSRT